MKNFNVLRTFESLDKIQKRNQFNTTSLIICLQDLAIQNLQFCFIWALTTTRRWWRFNPITRKIQENNSLSFSFFNSKKKPSVNVPLNNKWIKGTNLWWKSAAPKKVGFINSELRRLREWDFLNTLFLFYKNIVFPAQAEYSYFSADFRLKIFL